MLCEICHKNEATIHIQEIVGNQKKTINLCAECAAAKQTAGLNFGAFNIAEMIYKMAGAFPQTPAPADKADEELVCPVCHWDVEKLRQTGRLGCENCYSVFAPILTEALKSMHRGNQHLGKHPSGNPNAMALRQCRERLNKLQRQLQQSIEQEEYENAAALRDQINELKQQCDQAAAQQKEADDAQSAQ